jgi:hypothetical protein
MTLVITILGIIDIISTLSITDNEHNVTLHSTLSITILCITILSVMDANSTLGITDSQHNDIGI